MPDLERVYDALRKADAAGNVEDARRLAAYIREHTGDASAAPEDPRYAGPGSNKTDAFVEGGLETLPGIKQGRAAAEAIFDEIAERASGGVYGKRTFEERFSENVARIEGRREVLQEEEPSAYGYGTAAGIAGQVISGTGGIRGAISAGRGMISGGRALLTREGAKAAIPAAAKAVASRETAKAAAGGAAYGLAAEASEGEGEYATAALTGAGAAVGGRAIFGAGRAAVEARTAEAARKALAVKNVEAYDAAVAALPEERIRVTDANAAERARVKAANQEAKAAAKAQTEARQQAAERVARAEQLNNPMVRTGLEGKQKKLGGELRAEERAKALVAEPMPGDPGRKLVDVADEMSPSDRMKFAVSIRREQGRILGEIRDELGRRGAPTPTEELQAALARGFDDLPPEVQKRAQAEIRKLVGAQADGGRVSAEGLRKLIQDFETLGKVGSPTIDSALGKARNPVFRKAREVLVEREKDLVAAALPERAGEYAESLRRYGVYSDLELGSGVFLTRAQKGQPIIKEPRVKVPKVEPRLQEPALEATPRQPQFPGGPEAEREARAFLEPSRMGKIGRNVAQGAGGGFSALAGSYMAGAEGAVAGAALGGPAAASVGRAWERWLTPTTASLMRVSEKLEAIAPLMEEALRRGPQAIAVLHAQLMQQNASYRELFDDQSSSSQSSP